MDRETIMEHVNADDWSTVVAAFDGLEPDVIEADLDEMFPRDDNADLARAIRDALAETRMCILVTEDDGRYEIHPNAELEAWADVVALADEATRIEKLRGWGRWEAAYRVTRGPEQWIYFVDGTIDTTELS